MSLFRRVKPFGILENVVRCACGAWELTPCTFVISALNNQNKLKKEFFRSGIEYAKTMFVRILENEKDIVGKQHKTKEVDDLKYIQVLGLQKAIELTEGIDSEEATKRETLRVDR